MGFRSSGRSARPLAVVLTTVGGALVFGCALVLDIDERDRRPTQDDSGLTFDAGDVFVPVPQAVDPNACPTGQKRCANVCVSMKDPDFGCASETCDPCSLTNAATLECSDDGVCQAATCKKGYAFCGKPKLGCSYDLTSAATCGNCGTNCADPKVCNAGSCADSCSPGTTNCNGACVDVDTSATHCGACGNTCTAGANGDPACAKGKCIVECRTNYDHCAGNALTCELKTLFYTDADKDNYGDSKLPPVRQCIGGAGLAVNGGDCHDGDARVYPNQKGYFATPYTTPTGQSSYDYNCDGVELDPAGTPHFPGCTEDMCNGIGFVPAGSGRSGPGVNDYCGSTKKYQCVRAGSSGSSSGTILPMASSGSSGVETPMTCGASQISTQPNGCH